MSTTDLLAAVRAHDAQTVRHLLAHDETLRARIDDPIGDFGGTALLAAVGTDDRATVDALLDAGADIDARSNWWAGSFGVLDSCAPTLAPYLVHRGATLDANAAARLGMLAELTALLDDDPSRAHARGGDGQTPLHVASTVDVAWLLLDRGADIDALDVDHESTPAQYAIGDRPDIARYLVERGARTDLLLAAALGDIDRVRAHLDADPVCVQTTTSRTWFPMRNPHAGGTIYQWTLGGHDTAHAVAHANGHADVYALLMERTPAALALALACEVGDDAGIARLVAEHPRLIEALTPSVAARIANAAQKNATDVVRRMLAIGWPTTARGQHAFMPLHWAAWHGNAAMTRLLLDAHAPLEDRANDFGSTPLGAAFHGSLHGWHAQSGDYAETVRALLEAGAVVPNGLPEMADAVRRVLEGRA